MKKKYFTPVSAALMAGTLLASSLSPLTQACTRILWNNDPSSQVGVLVGRTMDWPTSTDPVLTFFPRGSVHNGGMLGSDVVITKNNNPLTWKAKYSTLVTTIYGIGAADGVNEKGLSAHLLYLNSTNMEPRDISKPGLQIGLWAQYVLDNAATVEDALVILDKIQIVMATVMGPNGHEIKGTVHLVMEDASGDSALIEYIDGKKLVHHNPNIKVVTNDPPYTQQMLALKSRQNDMIKHGEDIKHPNSNTSLPGNISPMDRLIRANYFLHLMPQPEKEQKGIASIFAITRNVSVPFGAPYKPLTGMKSYNTEYRTAISLKDRKYFFELTTLPNIVWASLNEINPPQHYGQVMQFDPYNANNINASGDISSQFIPVKAPY